MLSSSYELWYALKALGYLQEGSEPYWWKGTGSFEVIVGAILTQQSRWESVEKSLENLRQADLLELDRFVEADERQIVEAIKPSGFYNKKGVVLKALVKNIKKDFDNFEYFKEEVDREWLLEQKGIGFESADSILCYGCMRPVMVVDNYTVRLLGEFGYRFESYDALQEWMADGIFSQCDKIKSHYKEEVNCFTIASRFHGKVVEYVKSHTKAKSLSIEKLQEVLH